MCPYFTIQKRCLSIRNGAFHWENLGNFRRFQPGPYLERGSVDSQDSSPEDRWLEHHYILYIYIYIYMYKYIYICINKYIQDMVISKWYNHNSIYRKERKNHDDVKVHSEVLLFFVYSSHWILKNPAHGSNIWVPSGITLLWKLVHWSVELIMFNWLRGFSNAKKTLCKWLVKSGTWGHQRGHGDFPAVVPRCWMV